MFKAIVLALDGSEGSKRAIPVASKLAGDSGGKIVIAHVEERMATKGRAPVHADEDQIQADLQTLAKKLNDEGIETSVRNGDVMAGGAAAAHAIADIADQAGADLIVAGTRGHAPVTGLLLGSVTQRLLHIAKQPVLVVPDRG